MHVNSRRPDGSRLLFRVRFEAVFANISTCCKSWSLLGCRIQWKIFLGQKTRVKMWRFSDVSVNNSVPIFKGLSGDLLESKRFRFCENTSNTLKMETELFPETSENFHILTRLSDRENHRGSRLFSENKPCLMWWKSTWWFPIHSSSPCRSWWWGKKSRSPRFLFSNPLWRGWQPRNNLMKTLNPLTPNDNYSGRTAPLTSKVAYYIFIQQI